MEVLLASEFSAVPRCPVKAVVQTLGDGEELRISLNHHPAGIDPSVVGVADKEVQHLGDASAGSRGVHVPESPTMHRATGGLGGFLQSSGATCAQDLGQTTDRTRRHHYLSGLRHASHYA